METEGTVPFNHLPGATRARLSSCLQGRAGSGVLWAQQLPVEYPIGGAVFWAIAGAALLGLLAWAGFGDVFSSWSVHGGWHLAAWVFGAWLVVRGALTSWRNTRLGSALPYVAGIYLLPRDLIRTWHHRLAIRSLSDLEGLDLRLTSSASSPGPRRYEVWFQFADGEEVRLGIVRTFAEKDVDRLVEAFQAARGALAEALEEGDLSRVQALDPLAALHLGEAPGPERTTETGPLVQELPAVLRHAGAAALVAGLLLGVGGWTTRNHASDAAMVLGLEEALSSIRCHQYFRRGGWSSERVRAEILPRAEIAEARASGKIGGVRKLCERLGEAHSGGCDAAIEALAMQRLAEGREQRSVVALRAHQRDFPEPRFRALAADAISALHREALEHLRRRAPKKDEALVRFFERLLGWLEEHGTADVLVLSQGPTERALDRVDSYVARRAGYLMVAPVAPHFGGAHAHRRLRVLTDQLQRAFSRVLKSDVLRLRLPAGGRLEEDEAPPDLPSVEVRYKVKASGALYDSDKGLQHFVGIKVAFKVRLRLPSDPETYAFKVAVEPPDSFKVSYTASKYLALQGAPEGRVYDVMAGRAFDQLARKTCERLFGADNDACSEEGKAP